MGFSAVSKQALNARKATGSVIAASATARPSGSPGGIGRIIAQFGVDVAGGSPKMIDAGGPLKRFDATIGSRP